MGLKVSLDLFSPCLAPLVGQDYRLLKHPLRLGEADDISVGAGTGGILWLEIPALIEGVANRFDLEEGRVVEWSARRGDFDRNMLQETRDRAVPIPFIQAEIDAAVRAFSPVPVYFGLELVRQPGVIDIDPVHVVEMVKAGRAANAAGLVISWDLMHAPPDCIRSARQSCATGVKLPSAAIDD